MASRGKKWGLHVIPCNPITPPVTGDYGSPPIPTEIRQTVTVGHTNMISQLLDIFDRDIRNEIIAIKPLIESIRLFDYIQAHSGSTLCHGQVFQVRNSYLHCIIVITIFPKHRVNNLSFLTNKSLPRPPPPNIKPTTLPSIIFTFPTSFL